MLHTNTPSDPTSDLLSPNRLFKGLNPVGIVVVAVSGGSDSVALLLLANAWAQANNLTLHSVTVDHGLRPEAAAEAAFVAGLCEGLNIDHTTLGWEGIKPHSGIADAARRARYSLIEEFALEIGGDMILTGHTADDQAETILMRSSREIGMNHEKPTSLGRGLAGMPYICRLPGGRALVRPLLGITRDTLRKYLASIPQTWIEDPSNHDDAYERVRIRKHLRYDSNLRERLNRFGGVMTGFRSLLSRDTSTLLSATVKLQPGSVYRFDNEIASAAPVPVYMHALQMLIAVAGGGEYVTTRQSIEQLITALEDPDFSRTTLGGCIIERAGRSIRLYRENRNLPSLNIDPGDRIVWDGRMIFTNRSSETLWIGPTSRQRLLDLEVNRKRTFQVRPRAALLSGPLVQSKSGNLWLPMVEKNSMVKKLKSRLTARAIEHFCPKSDYVLLEWLQGLEDARNACLEPRS
jgi:tRNA(Ile)-lysidine synthase